MQWLVRDAVALRCIAASWVGSRRMILEPASPIFCRSGRAQCYKPLVCVCVCVLLRTEWYMPYTQSVRVLRIACKYDAKACSVGAYTFKLNKMW